MSPILFLSILAAIALDLAAIWGWRYWRTRRAAANVPAPPQPPPRLVEVAFVRLERTGHQLAGAAASLLRLFREEALSDERGRLRVSILVACLVLNASIGYAYADTIMVQGWQLWTWILVCIVAIVVLMPTGGVRLRWSREAWLVLGLTIVSAALRLTALGQFPAGLHGDEGRLADFTLIHVYPEPGLTLSPFRVGLYSQPTLYNYIIWISMRLLGENIVGLRLASAVAGTLAVPMTYFAVSQFSAERPGGDSGRRVALFSAVLMATYHYHIQWSRLSLNNIWDTLWIPAMLGFFAWGWSARQPAGAVLSGVALGLSQYFYAGSKIALFLLPFTAYTLWRQDLDTRRLLLDAGRGLTAAVIIAAPILAFSGRAPSLVVERLNVVYFWNDMASSGIDPAGLGWLEMIRDQAFRAVVGFTSLTDRTGFYRAGVPLVMGLAAPLFLAGVVWAILQRQFIPVVWIGLTVVFGGFLLSATPSSSHYVAAIPAVAWLIALLLDGIWRHVRPWLAIVLLVAIVASDIVYYFGVYVPSDSPGDFDLPFPK